MLKHIPVRSRSSSKTPCREHGYCKSGHVADPYTLNEWLVGKVPEFYGKGFRLGRLDGYGDGLKTKRTNSPKPPTK